MNDYIEIRTLRGGTFIVKAIEGEDGKTYLDIQEGDASGPHLVDARYEETGEDHPIKTLQRGIEWLLTNDY